MLLLLQDCALSRIFQPFYSRGEKRCLPFSALSSPPPPPPQKENPVRCLPSHTCRSPPPPPQPPPPPPLSGKSHHWRAGVPLRAELTFVFIFFCLDRQKLYCIVTFPGFLLLLLVITFYFYYIRQYKLFKYQKIAAQT